MLPYFVKLLQNSIIHNFENNFLAWGGFKCNPCGISIDSSYCNQFRVHIGYEEEEIITLYLNICIDSSYCNQFRVHIGYEKRKLKLGI